MIENIDSVSNKSFNLPLKIKFINPNAPKRQLVIHRPK